MANCKLQCWFCKTMSAKFFNFFFNIFEVENSKYWLYVDLGG